MNPLVLILTRRGFRRGDSRHPEGRVDHEANSDLAAALALDSLKKS
jgi:hypothetical protein